MIGLCQVFAKEVGSRGIVQLYRSGFIITEMTAGLLRGKSGMAKNIPLRRGGTRKKCCYLPGI